MSLDSSARINVSGHLGMVGSALVHRLERADYTNLITRTHAERDLLDLSDTLALLRETRHANNARRSEFSARRDLTIGARLVPTHQPARKALRRRTPTQDPHVAAQRFKLRYGDLTNSTHLISIILQMRPDEAYNLAGHRRVAGSFETPEYTTSADGIGTLRILEAISVFGLEKGTRCYRALPSSTVWYKRCRRRSPRPYAVAKLEADFEMIRPRGSARSRFHE